MVTTTFRMLRPLGFNLRALMVDPCSPSGTHSPNRPARRRRAGQAVPRGGQAGALFRVHFATHGYLAGESEAILKANAELVLLLTLPRDGTGAAELE